MVCQPLPLIKPLVIICLVTTLWGCGASTPVQPSNQTTGAIPDSANVETAETAQPSDNPDTELDPKVATEFDRGVDAMTRRDYDRAEAIFHNISLNHPDLPGPYANLGVVLKAKKDYQNAEIALKRALNLNPYNGEVYNHLGLVYRESGRFNNALEIYKQGLEFAPNNTNLLRNTGILFELYLNIPEAALPYYERYLEKKPNDKQVQIWIADLNLRLKR